MFPRLSKFLVVAVVVASSIGAVAYATHAWGNYHWARTLNPFSLKLGDNVSSAWDGHLLTASGDWSVSSVLDTSIVAGQSKGNCRPTNGRVEVCNKTYGANGWLGLAQIWVSGNHITQGVAKVNDTYFNTATYNTPAWRQFVLCQEVGHTFGLSHQDENFSNLNLGTCMDYTNDPSGTLSNQLNNKHPNTHDYDQLDLIYSHLDSVTTVGQSLASGKSRANVDVDLDGPADWGKVVKRSAKGHASLYERDLGKGDKVFTFVIWAE